MANMLQKAESRMRLFVRCQGSTASSVPNASWTCSYAYESLNSDELENRCASWIMNYHNRRYPRQAMTSSKTQPWGLFGTSSMSAPNVSECKHIYIYKAHQPAHARWSQSPHSCIPSLPNPRSQDRGALRLSRDLPCDRLRLWIQISSHRVWPSRWRPRAKSCHTVFGL